MKQEEETALQEEETTLLVAAHISNNHQMMPAQEEETAPSLLLPTAANLQLQWPAAHDTNTATAAPSLPATSTRQSQPPSIPMVAAAQTALHDQALRPLDNTAIAAVFAGDAAPF
jgi:hypothetical protein